MSVVNYSFIIPHKNCPGLLKRCVDSIPEREDVQIIVVDDNSDEDKKPALQERTGFEIVLLNASQSKGAGRARNVGMSKAVGKWLLFPDSDDYYVDGFLDFLDRYKESDVDVVYFNFEFRDGKTGEELTPLPFRIDFDEYDGSNRAKESIRYHHNVPWTKMAKRTFVEKNKLYYEEVSNGNDMFFSMMCGYYVKNIVVEKKPLYVYLKSAGGITSKVLRPKEALCYIEHVIKQNAFFRKIKHTEWTQPTIRIILYLIKMSKWNFIFLLIRKIPALLGHRNDWVLFVNNKSVSK